MKPIYLGIVGQIASGKGEVVKILTGQYGFVSFNLSSILHTILDEKGIINFTRADLQDLGDKLRKEEGEGVLAKRAVNVVKRETYSVKRALHVTRYTIHDKYIIEGIRNPAEVNYLRTLPNFKLIAVKAKKKVRFERLRKRGKPWDPKTWKEFLVVDRRDKGLHEKKYGQQVGKCIKMADIRVQNDGDLSLLKKKVTNCLVFCLS